MINFPSCRAALTAMSLLGLAACSAEVGTADQSAVVDEDGTVATPQSGAADPVTQPETDSPSTAE